MISDNEVKLLREKYSRLMLPSSINMMIESCKLIIDAGFNILYQHGRANTITEVWDHDANILFQMSHLKSLSLHQLSQPINYTNNIDGVSLHNIHDPFAMYNIVRSQYEAYCNFNNIFIQAKSEDELKLKYYLWVISGLNYRQRLKAESDFAKKKKASEAEEIGELNKLILENSSYNQLDVQSKNNILNCIKKREWQVKIEGNKAYKIAWHEMMTNAGGNDMLEGQYSYLSLATHPSNVSVFQFSSMYVEKQQEFNTKMALELSIAFMAMFIRDYVVYFKLQNIYFNNLPQIPQMIINSYNMMFRNDSYRVNDINNLLG